MKASIMVGITFLLMVGVIAGTCFAETPTTINACYKKDTGQMRFVNTLAQCKASEVAIWWNVTGPQGPMGPMGPQGVADLSKLYLKYALNLPQAYCNDNDVAISCSGDCGDGKAQIRHEVIPFGWDLGSGFRYEYTDNQPGVCVFLCMDPSDGSSAATERSEVTCLPR